MSRSKLGIDVEIKYPSKTAILDGMKKAWSGTKAEFEAKVNVAPDKNSMSKMKTSIQSFLDSYNFDFKLRLDTAQAMKDMRELRKEFNEIRKIAEDGMEVKFFGATEANKDFKEINKSIKETSDKNKVMERDDMNRQARLREITGLYKELSSLQSKGVSAGGHEQAIYNKRIEELSVQLQLAKNEYKQIFGASSDDSWMVQNVKRVGEFNVELKEAQQHQRETNQLVSEYRGLLNDEFKIQKELQRSGEGQSRVLEEQLVKVREKQQYLLKEEGMLESMSAEQAKGLNALTEQNAYQLKLTEAKRKDAEVAKQQDSTYKELKSSMNEIHKIQVKINDLQAKSDKGVATAREEDTLVALKHQLKYKEDMHKVSKDVAQSEGMIAKEAQNSLDALKKQHQEKEKMSKSTSDVNADLKVTNRLYDDMMSSVKRVNSLTKELASAGDKEANVIRNQIRLEENKQEEIKDTLKAQQRVNQAREEEYSTMKRVNSEQEQISAERAQARQQDKFNENSTIGMIDPRAVYNQGKQVAMQIYDVVSELDVQMTDIEKVADASEAEMNRFKENVFSFASEVGVSADVYASSVERWLTQGFELNKAMELATSSTMGAFVGNVNEEDMVNYMSVPLLAYKDAGLEVADVLNAMNEVANNNAIEMDDLGKAYQRSANTASTTGTTFAELTGLITGAQEATRLGGDTIGTSMRAIDMNFSKMGSQLTKADVTRTAFFKDIGVDILDTNGNLNSTYDIIEQLSGVWGDLNSKDQSTASFYAGGKMHAQTLQGIIKQWGVVEKVAGEAKQEIALVDKESGSAYREFEAMQSSVQFAVAGLKNAWSEFIHEISGGRDGVTMVVDKLREMVELATKVAKNDTLMAFAKTFLKATLWLTASVAMGKVFTTLKGGLLNIIGLADGTMGAFGSLFGVVQAGGTGFSNTAKLAGVLTGKLGGLAQGTGLVAKMAGGALNVGGGLTSTMGLLGGVLGKLIPVIGLTAGAVALLELAGVPVIDTFKSMLDGTSSLSKAVREYGEVHERTTKVINSNGILNNEFQSVNELIDKYKALNEEKEKNSGSEAKPFYSKDEFELLQQEVAVQAEALDIELEIAFNDYDHIKSQLDELEKQKKLLESSSAKELADNIMERNKLPTNHITYDKSYEDEFKNLNSRRDQAEIGGYVDEMNALNKEIAEYSRTSKLFTDTVFNSADFKEAKKAREELIESARETRKELVNIHENIIPEDLGEEKSFFMGQEMLPALAEMNNRFNNIKGLTESISDNGDLTAEQYKLLVDLLPELAGKSTEEIKNWSDAEKEAIVQSINGQAELEEETRQSVENRIRALLEFAGEDMIGSEEIEETLEKIKNGHIDVIDVMADLGETGRAFMGVTEEALVMYGDEWANVMKGMQEGIEALPAEKVTKYNLLTDDGFFNWDIIEMISALPEEVVTEYSLLDDNNEPVLDNILGFLEGIPEEKITEYGLTDKYGNLSIEKVTELIKELNEEEVEIDIFANPEAYDKEKKGVESKNKELENTDPTVSIKGEDSGFRAVNAKVDAEVAKEKTQIVRFKAIREGWDKVAGWLKGSSSVAVGSASVGIGSALALGTSESVGTSESKSSGSKKKYVKKQYPKKKKDTNKKEAPPAKVDQKVWRYWSKELYQGMALENSMDKLNNSIQNARDDNKQLISLYKEQNSLSKQRINYEKSMKSAQQSEMNSLLSQLRKEGFKTSGNQITNFGIAKNMSGDKAERVSGLLNQYNSLYKAIDSTNDSIRKLNQDIITSNKNIKDAQQAIKDAEEEERKKKLEEAIKKELEGLEKSAKRAEGLLTNISNDTDIFATKLGLISDSDYELKMSITEEGLNKSSKNIESLIAEFNKLSKISIKYEENADSLTSELESLKSEILSNADSILAYRDAMKELEIERMTADFDKFTSSLESNLGKISNNIENVRDGLLSGQSLSDLASSTLMGIDFNRKTKLERDYEQRLELERELNVALDAFAKKNIDRVKNVANDTLQIEQKKYSELLRLANGFSNGKVESVSINTPSQSIGAVQADTSKGKDHQKWTDDLVAINNSYVKAYNAMVEKYDKAMKNAKTSSEKELISNAMIIEQLKLQESIYGSMIVANNEAIKNTESMLKDSSLTTEQRQELQDLIESYKQSNTDAQNSIKDSIKSRFDLEFDLLDKAIEKSQKYTSELSHMMNIAEAIGSSSDVMNELYKSLYQSKINEYASATEIIKNLADQQSKFEEGSFEWSILEGKISDIKGTLNDLTLEILNANKDILSSQLDIIQKSNEESTLGSSAEDYDKYLDTWIDGVEKELELEALRMKLSGLDDKRLLKEIELMDRQEKVSKAELEYVDKQLEAVRLEEKLENLRGERNIQTLTKDANGNWQWEYVADQSEYDSTKGELNDLKLEIEKYREEQKRNYVSEMNEIISRIKDGDFKDVVELETAIDNVHGMFEGILGDIDDMKLYDTSSIIKAYQDYLASNDSILTDTKNNGHSDNIAGVGEAFKQSFESVATDLGELIAKELRNALNASPIEGKGNSIVIENQVLEFPNITDANGLEDAIRDLPQVAKQISLGK